MESTEWCWLWGRGRGGEEEGVGVANHVLEGIDPSVSSPDLQGEERDRRLDQLPVGSDLISHAYVMNPP